MDVTRRAGDQRHTRVQPAGSPRSRLHVQCHLDVAAFRAIVGVRIGRPAHTELHDRRLRDAHLPPGYRDEAFHTIRVVKADADSQSAQSPPPTIIQPSIGVDLTDWQQAFRRCDGLHMALDWSRQ